MKIQLTVLFSFLLGTANALSQGMVLFANNVPFATAADRLVYADVVGGTKLVGTNFVAQLYYGADAEHLIAVTNEPARFRSPTTSLPGTWTQSPANRTLLGFALGEQLTLQVRAWDGSLFNAYEDAVAGGGAHGQSDPFEYVIPPPNTPPLPAAFFMENLRAFALNLPLSTNNHAPIAYSQSILTAINTPADLTLLATDIDGDSLTYTVTAPSYGTLTGTPPKVTYTPAFGYAGEDYFTFKASDGRLESSATEVTILISAGGTVFFRNNEPFATAADRLVYADFVGGTKLVGTNYVAQLYYGADAAHLITVTNEPAKFRSPTTTAPGTWTQTPVNRLLLGFLPGEQLFLQVRVWDGSLFNTFEDAVAGGGAHGQSDPFLYMIPPPNFPPSPAAFFMENLRAFALIPALSTNTPPVAVSQVFSPFLFSYSATNIQVIAPDNSNALVILDGTLSVDAESNILQFHWFAAGAPQPFDAGIRVTNLFVTGTHLITLGVSDGTASSTTTFTLEIITPEAAARALAGRVASANLARKTERSLQQQLSEAETAFSRGHFASGVHQLSEFQEDVVERVTKSDPALAQDLVTLAQKIINAVSQPLITGSIQELILLVEASNIPSRVTKELLEELREAVNDFAGNHLREGVEDLRKFQKQVHRGLTRIDEVIAEHFTQAAQQILDQAQTW